MGGAWGSARLGGDPVSYMFGQLCEVLPLCGAGLVEGVVAVELPVVGVVDVLVLVLVLVVELAALAIAPPAPTSAPVTARVVSNGFNRPMDHLLSAAGLWGRSTIRVQYLRGVGRS